jgi:two-component system LytT family sensor kinase
MNLFNRISNYWLCQIGGWGVFILVYIFFYLTLRTRPQEYFYQDLFLLTMIGIVITHLMREVIKYFQVVTEQLNHQIIYLILLTIIFALLYASLASVLERVFNIEENVVKKLPLYNKILRSSISSFFLMAVWNLIYFSYHYVEKARKSQIDTIRLEALIKELELKTIKSHINPHFMFNALNSIRALIDENPFRARNAITELSNILRSSMQTEKSETVPFEKELGIVKDYLALEHIRFEDRLQIEYQIDEETLDQPVPPMMLQTLVENAIKHGIGKQEKGGMVKVISDFRGNYHEMIVQNSGVLNGHINGDGFGLSSTKNRLHLLFGEKANFEITQYEGMVEAKVSIPIELNKVT